MNPLVDIGANLTHSQFNKNIEQILNDALAVGVEKIVITGTSVEDSQAAIKLAKQFPSQLSCTCGIHPHDAKEWNSESLFQLKEMLDNPMVKASGETGLDFNRNYSPKDQQIFAFEQQIELSIAHQKPLFLHQRDAHETFMGVLKNNRDKLNGVVVHCFTDSKKALYEYLDEGFSIGITGWICDPKRGQELAQLVSHIPIKQLMIETDAPYLLPKNMLQSNKDRTNYPHHLPHIAQTIADLRKITLKELSLSTHQNSIEFFQL